MRVSGLSSKIIIYYPYFIIDNMFFYLIHTLPHSTNLDDGNRNVRTIFLGIILYIIFHATIFSDFVHDKLPPLTSLRSYFYYIFVADLLTITTLYKIRYDKILWTELDFNYGSSKPKHINRPLHCNPRLPHGYIDDIIPEYVQKPTKQTVTPPNNFVKDEQMKQHEISNNNDKKQSDMIKSQGEPKKSKKKIKPCSEPINDSDERPKKSDKSVKSNKRKKQDKIADLKRDIINKEIDEMDNIIKKNLSNSNLNKKK
jgi:hypothetical protein